MRIYTCVFEKGGMIGVEDISAPWHLKPAEDKVRAEFGLTTDDRLIAMIPGQHASRAIVVDGRRICKKAADEIIRNYVPNGF